MSLTSSPWLPRLLVAVGAGLIATGGWLGWRDGAPDSVLHVDGPVQLGTIRTAADHAMVVSVTNTGREPIRLAGLDGELC